ncbi:AbrB/MazE/SpoVT family DNA-binding domain-containing protein [Candidatus Woesearchaeota archaeon]|nr:AbrB/MazE/SpoVT family DNA-binding domain-containing protein [Candidatus Woesearchaeota archaeon]
MLSRTKTVGSKGEIVIPKSIREETGLKPKQKVEIISTRDRILIIPLVNNISELRGLFGKGGVKNIKKIEEIMFDVMGS